MNPEVGIIIVNWNGLGITKDCLRSCVNIDYKKINIFLVDNGSTDYSVEELKKEFPTINYVLNECNKGFSGGVNPGIQNALSSGCEYVWLLNNDARPDTESLSNMITISENCDRKCIVGSVIYKGNKIDKNKKIEVVGGGTINFLTGRSTANKKHDGLDLDYISGASMLIPKCVLDKIGGFDEKYFMYYEDVDFCYRAKKNGFKLIVSENSHIWHMGSASTQGDINPIKDGYAAKSCVLFFKKHGHLSYFPAIVAMSLRSIKRMICGQFKCVVAIIQGLSQGISTR